MKIHLTTRLRSAALAAGTLVTLSTGAVAAQDASYQENDLVMFFRNPNGTVGQNTVVAFSLGSTWDLFRRAATPTDPAFGTLISLGNINTMLGVTYGANWSSLSPTLFVGAAGVGPGALDPESDYVELGDWSRTVYITSPRNGAGSFRERDSGNRNFSSGNAATTIISGNIGGANSVLLNTNGNPVALPNDNTTIDTWNPITTNNFVNTAYGGISSGIMGAVSSNTYTYGSVSNVVRGLDLYRITPKTNNDEFGGIAWQNENNIAMTYGGGTVGSVYYLGTITLSDNGDVNFTAVPEPSTYALLALAAAGLGARLIRRRSK